jgi:hypothetical protein
MKPKIVIAYPFGGRPVPVDWHLAVRSLIIPTNSRTVEIFRRSMTLDEAQTSMVEQALELGSEYILFIEDDTAPPPGVIIELSRVLETADESFMACGGIYTTRCDPPEPIVYMGPGQGSYWNWKMGDIFPCWAVGFGCLMLKTKIFRMMPKPWFKTLSNIEQVREYPELFPIEESSKNSGVSGDMFFYTKLAQMGFKVLAHGGVLPIHWSPDNKSYWLPANFGPTDGVIYEGKPFGWTNPDMVKV